MLSKFIISYILKMHGALVCDYEIVRTVDIK